MLPDFFLSKLSAAQRRSGGLLLLELSPHLTTLPLPIQRYDEPYLPFGKAVIGATSDLVVGFLFDFSAYLATGAAGIVALERTIAYIRTFPDVLAILDSGFDRAGYADGASALSVDAVTISGLNITDPFIDVGIAALISDDLRFFRLIGGAQINAARDEDFALQIRDIVIAHQTG